MSKDTGLTLDKWNSMVNKTTSDKPSLAHFREESDEFFADVAILRHIKYDAQLPYDAEHRIAHLLLEAGDVIHTLMKVLNEETNSTVTLEEILNLNMEKCSYPKDDRAEVFFSARKLILEKVSFVVKPVGGCQVETKENKGLEASNSVTQLKD